MSRSERSAGHVPSGGTTLTSDLGDRPGYPVAGSATDGSNDHVMASDEATVDDDPR